VKLTFRTAALQDASRAAALIDDAYRRQVRRLYGNSRRGRWGRFDRERMKQYIERGEGMVRLGFDGKRLLTVAPFRFYGAFGWLHTVAVHSAHQRRGLGRQMMTDALEQLEARGVRLIALMTWPEAVNNVGFYQNFGFRVNGFSLYAYRRAHRPLARGDAPLEAQWLSQTAMSATHAPPTPYRPREDIEQAIRSLCHAVLPGLDYAAWVWWMVESGGGDALLLWRGAELIALALAQAAPNTTWLEGKLLLVSPEATAQETIWMLEFARRWAVRHGCESFGFPIDVSQTETAAFFQRLGFRLFGDAMLTMIRGPQSPSRGIHLVRYGG